VPHSTSGAVDIRTDDARVRVVFSDDERHLIHSYYYDRYHNKKMPPGLAKKETLPPGLQKQIVRNGRLPPGLEGRRLPYDLERRLHRLPEDYIRVIIGTDVVLMDRRTRVIFDVISNVAF
jgi:hypothetical protein